MHLVITSTVFFGLTTFGEDSYARSHGHRIAGFELKEKVAAHLRERRSRRTSDHGAHAYEAFSTTTRRSNAAAAGGRGRAPGSLGIVIGGRHRRADGRQLRGGGVCAAPAVGCDRAPGSRAQ